MRIMGLDYGDSRIGGALSDEFGWTASPLCVVESKRGKKKALNELKRLIADNSVDTVVVGYPLNMDGSEGIRTDVTNQFVFSLEAAMPSVNVIKWDERLTTVAADRAMREMGIKQRAKGMNDVLAAVFILQGYLDSKRS